MAALKTTEAASAPPERAGRRRAVFLDRDGVLIRDIHLLCRPGDMELLPGVADGLRRLKEHGFLLIVATNQTVVSRGLLTLSRLEDLHRELAAMIERRGGPGLDAFYVCPHHPRADLPAYRIDCRCRKPAPGLLLRARREWGIDLERSYMIGDRMTDIWAGHAAGCHTVQLLSGRHREPLISFSRPVDRTVRPDQTAADFSTAVAAILSREGGQ